MDFVTIQLTFSHSSVVRILLHWKYTRLGAIMLRPSPTIISLSKRDVREHFENISRRATTSRCHKVTQPASAKSPFQRDFNLQKDFTGDLQVPSWNPQDIHCPRRRISEEVVGDQSNSLDDSPESRFSNSTDTEETSQMMTSNLLS